MTPEIQSALDRRDRFVTVAGDDTLPALQFIGAHDGRVQTMTRGETPATWELDIYWTPTNKTEKP